MIFKYILITKLLWWSRDKTVINENHLVKKKKAKDFNQFCIPIQSIRNIRNQWDAEIKLKQMASIAHMVVAVQRTFFKKDLQSMFTDKMLVPLISPSKKQTWSTLYYCVRSLTEICIENQTQFQS